MSASSDLPPMRPDLMMRGADPTLLRDDLLHIIGQRIDRHPRSQQKTPGPSELGNPCTRRLGYKLLAVDPTNPRQGAWKPTVGTAVHTWLHGAFQAFNEAHTVDRFYLEEKVCVGHVAGVDIVGSCDCYDRTACTVIDWKIVGLAGLKRYRLDGPGEQYRRQVHLYGRGFVNAGLPVDHVAIMFLPQNGDLRDALYWTEPYDEALALDTLTKAEGVASLTASLGRTALPMLPTAEAFCSYCPFYLPGATDPTEACAGHKDPVSSPLPVSAAPAA